MTVVLLPRLDRLAVDGIFARLEQGADEATAIEAMAQLPDAMTFAATGGRQATDEEFREIREGITEIARRHGLGGPVTRAGQAGFDAEAASWLATLPALDSGEALRDDTWAFIASVLLASVVLWRFGLARERFHGGVRNTFQRLWMRGRALDRGAENADRWGLLRELTEDSLVQISERASIGADQMLARAIGEAWVRAAARLGRSRMEPIMRRAMTEIRLRNEIIGLSDLGDALPGFLDGEFERAAARVTEAA